MYRNKDELVTEPPYRQGKNDMNETRKDKFHTLTECICREGRSNGRIKSCKMWSVIKLPTSGIPAETMSLI